MTEEQTSSAKPTNVKKESTESSEILSISILQSERLARNRALIEGQNEGGVHQAITPDNSLLGSRLTAQSKQVVFDRLAALSVDKQAQVVGSAIAAFEGQWRSEKFAMMLGLISGGAFEQARSAQETLLSLGEVRRFCAGAHDHEAKRLTAESLATVLVCGVKLFSIAEFARLGEYGLYFRDFLSLKMSIDRAFQQLPQNERRALLNGLGTLGETVVCFRPERMATSESITASLEDMGVAASEFGTRARAGVVAFFSRVLVELL